ncbi:src kinase-associated phosphoprotein 1-like isoform X2 [Myxocyprinus asiaticus]|uniref:src kinase-associated phosphoprotein 1-like isoform X2 n=1 Tax=Myxocyprinus asiaticus TaxID=70543 RepID=UPI0022237A66|nr:src kinase-associated phosphoprotein 1-like isoform X2 [Myxocyprinus asiaticus]
MGTVADDIRQLLKDCELFVFEILQDENLSDAAHKSREILLRNFYVIQKRHPQEFPHRFESNREDSSDDNQSSSLGPSAPSDDMSMASDYQEEGAPELFEEIPMVAAQDLSNILKQGYLEKKRRDHSFFSMEWQKRWCVLNNTIFYYFGSEKDKQQKGSFYINGYSAELVPSLRKDSKKNSCFEMSAPGRRSYQFTASGPHEAREWVDQINFVLKDLSSNFIPFDDDEDEEVEEEEETYDDIERATTPPPPRSGPAPTPIPTPSLGQPPQSTCEEWKEQARTQEEEEEDEEDIYEMMKILTMLKREVKKLVLQIMQIITKACGTVKRMDQMSWPSKEETLFTSSARNITSMDGGSGSWMVLLA